MEEEEVSPATREDQDGKETPRIQKLLAEAAEKKKKSEDDHHVAQRANHKEHFLQSFTNRNDS